MQVSQPGETKRRILEELRRGPITVSALSKALKINKTALRIHLEGLEKIVAVESRFKTEGRGRPKKYFKLTTKGMETFTRRYELFLSQLLRRIVDSEGFAYVEKLISSLASHLGKQLVKTAPEKGEVKTPERLDLVVRALDEMGFEATKEVYEDKASIISKNCIIYQTAVENHDLICHAFHDKLIEQALPGAQVELKECIAEAAPYCRHIIRFPAT